MLERRLAWSGVVFVALTVLGYALVAPYPATDDPAADVVDFYEDRSAVLASVVFAALGLPFFVVFLGALRAALRREEGEAGALSAIAVIAGSAVASVAFVQAALHGAAAFNPDESPLLFDVASLLFVFTAFAVAALIGAASVAGLATRVLPRVVSTAGLAVAALQLPAGASVASGGVFSPTGLVPIGAFVLFLVWVFATSVSLARR